MRVLPDAATVCRGPSDCSKSTRTTAWISAARFSTKVCFHQFALENSSATGRRLSSLNRLKKCRSGGEASASRTLETNPLHRLLATRRGRVTMYFKQRFRFRRGDRPAVSSQSKGQVFQRPRLETPAPVRRVAALGRPLRHTAQADQASPRQLPECPGLRTKHACPFLCLFVNVRLSEKPPVTKSPLDPP